jgi:hypothetical protein
MTAAELERKFRALAEPVLPEVQILELLDALRGLEDVREVGELLRLTVPAA